MASEARKAGQLPLSAHASPPGISTASHALWKRSALFRRIAVVILALGFYVVTKSAGIMSFSNNDVPQYSNTIFIPFVYKFSHKDTGSTGLLIGAPILPNIDAHTGEPAHHFFTSSKILYVGRLVKVPVSFHGEAGTTATANVPIFVVDKSWRCPWYKPGHDSFDCPPGPDGETAQERNTSNITYMGVGFGRNSPRDGMPFAAPRVNPFLNLDTIDGVQIPPTKMRPGYIITTKGVHLGLTCQNMKGFVFESLEPGVTHDRDGRDWAMARMCFRINGKGETCGAVLVDTGIAQMYIRPSKGISIPSVTIRNPNKHGYAETVERVKRGTQITVAFPSFNDQAISYSFIVGEGSNVEPNFVVPARATAAPYVNTGRNLLNGYSIAFDAADGRFGLGPVHPSSSSIP